MAVKAIYPGTFDPLTIGHEDIISRALGIFPQLIIAVAASAQKNTLFSLQERIAMVEGACKQWPQVSVLGFANLTVAVAKEQGAQVIVRGLRSAADFDLELKLAAMNQAMAVDIETVFLPTASSSANITASIVREIAAMHGDVTPFVSPLVAEKLQQKFSGDC